MGNLSRNYPLVTLIIVLAPLRSRQRNTIPSLLRNDDCAEKEIDTVRDVFSTFNPRRLFTCRNETRYSNHLVTVYRIVYKGWATINRPCRTPASIIQGPRFLPQGTRFYLFSREYSVLRCPSSSLREELDFFLQNIIITRVLRVRLFYPETFMILIGAVVVTASPNRGFHAVQITAIIIQGFTHATCKVTRRSSRRSQASHGRTATRVLKDLTNHHHRRRCDEGFALHSTHYLVLNPLADERIELHTPPNTRYIMGTTGRGPHRFSRTGYPFYIILNRGAHTHSLSSLPSSLLLLLFITLLSNPNGGGPRRRESSDEKGWRRDRGALRKGGADFHPRACLCERPLAGHPISSFRMAGINRREMERNGPIRGFTQASLRNPPLLETLEHPPESSIRPPARYLGRA